MPSRARAVSLLVVTVIAVVVLAAGSDVSRAGYTLDEEITAAVVPSLSQTGVPRLPSGVVYLRGLPYEYSAWLAGSVGGHTLRTYRLVSLGFAIAGVVTMFAIGEAFGSTLSGGAAAILLAAAPAYIDASGFARAYSQYICFFLCALLSFHYFYVGRWTATPFLLLLPVCRLLHEFGSIVAVIPVTYALVQPPAHEARRRVLRIACLSIASAIVLEVAIYALVQQSLQRQFVFGRDGPSLFVLPLPSLPPLHLFSIATPASLLGVSLPLAALATASSRLTRLWFVSSVCALLGMLFQLGSIVAFIAMALIARPQQRTRYLLVGSTMFSASFACWTLHTLTQTGAVPTYAFVQSLFLSGLHYPFGGWRHLWISFPLAAVVLGVVIGWLISRDRTSTDTSDIRAVVLLATVGLFAFGVLGIEIKPRLFLLVYPLVLIVCAAGLHAVRFTGRSVVSGLLLVALLVTPHLYRRAERPKTIQGIVPVAPADVVICSEELACKYLFGRVDYLLLTTPGDLADYGARTREGWRGLYAYSPVLTSDSELEAVIRHAAPQTRSVLVLLNTGKVDHAHQLAATEQLRRRFAGQAYSNDNGLMTFFSSRS